MPQIGRVGNPHVRSQCRHPDGGIAPSIASILRGSQPAESLSSGGIITPVALYVAKVSLVRAQRHSGTTARIRGVGDQRLLEFKKLMRGSSMPQISSGSPWGWAWSCPVPLFDLPSSKPFCGGARHKGATVHVDPPRGKAGRVVPSATKALPPH